MKTDTINSCGGLVILLAIIYYPMTLWCDRTLDFWLTFAKGAPVDAPIWISFLAAVFAPATFTINLVSEIVRLAV